MIGIANPEYGHLTMVDIPVEVAIVDSNLKLIFQSKMRPDELPPTGPISIREFSRRFSHRIGPELERPSIQVSKLIFS